VYFIGIDLSTKNTGIVVLDNKKKLKEFKLIKATEKDIKDRSFKIIQQVFSFLSPYKNSIIYLESPSFFSKGKVVDLAMLNGAVYYKALELGYDIRLITPSAVKKAYIGNGRASKEEMIEFTPKHILNEFQKEERKIDDLVDAYAMALYAYKTVVN
jgi:Holliday junction resolvasome RuvABC endonuclease subunit